MNGAFDAQAELLFQLQDQQYKEMLAEAQDSVAHMEEVVKKYEVQVCNK
jgi:multidrug resistance efflux pump